MTSLITGGAGFIGSHLAERLLASREKVLIIDDFSTGTWENIDHLIRDPLLTVVEGSVLDRAELQPMVASSDVIYHLASAVGVKRILTNPLSSLHTNIYGTGNVLELASRYGKKVVLASTSEVYGKSSHMPLSENSDRVMGPTTITRWSYSSAKVLDECLALAYSQEESLQVIIIRLFNIVGPKQSSRYGMVLPTFVQQALAGKPITVYGDGEQTRTFTYVDDAVDAITKLVHTPEATGEIFNIGSTNTVTIKQLAQIVKTETSSNSAIIHVPYEIAYGDRYEDVRYRVPDIDKLRRFTGYEPHTSLVKIIQEAVLLSRAALPVTSIGGSINN